jgi:hypothetical protein
MIERMDLATARAKRDAQIKRRAAPPPPPHVRLTNETYRPTPTSDESGLLAVSGIVARTKIWDGSPIDPNAFDPSQRNSPTW